MLPIPNEFLTRTQRPRGSYTRVRQSLPYRDSAGKRASRWLCTCRTNDLASDSERQVGRRVFQGGTYPAQRLAPPVSAVRPQKCCESAAAFPETRVSSCTFQTMSENAQAYLQKRLSQCPPM